MQSKVGVTVHKGILLCVKHNLGQQSVIVSVFLVRGEVPLKGDCSTIKDKITS